MECKGLDYDVCQGEILTQIKSAPQLFRVVRRPNSPPPELLDHRIFFLLLDVNLSFEIRYQFVRLENLNICWANSSLG